MIKLLKSRTALSTVVTTLIILVVSVLLAGVVTYFAINVVSTSVQQEALNLTYQHVWYSTSDNLAEVGLVITNTGGRDVVLQNVAVRGQSVPTGYIFYYTPAAVADLAYINQTKDAASDSPSVTKLDADGASGSTAWASVPSTSAVILGSGKTIALYAFSNSSTTTPFSPGSVTVNDVGLTIAISIFTAQATYIKETNVNTAP
jgi:hypothetical protein